MGEDWKYIVFGGEDTAVIFPPHIAHADFKFMETTLGPIISAGRVSFSKDGSAPVCCYGDAPSLGTKANPIRDQKLIVPLLRNWD